MIHKLSDQDNWGEINKINGRKHKWIDTITKFSLIFLKYIMNISRSSHQFQVEFQNFFCSLCTHYVRSINEYKMRVDLERNSPKSAYDYIYI